MRNKNISSDASTKIYAAGLVDEGVEYERMEREIEALKLKIASSKPICPHCTAELIPFLHIGYYDEVSGWGCECMKIPGVEESRGAYA